MQRDKDAAVQQLRACAPERFERLHDENQALRKANSELKVLREQVLHHKKAWQDAERKQLDNQVAGWGETGPMRWLGQCGGWGNATGRAEVCPGGGRRLAQWE